MASPLPQLFNLINNFLFLFIPWIGDDEIQSSQDGKQQSLILVGEDSHFVSWRDCLENEVLFINNLVFSG
jgi:hypothetical protein